MKSPPRLLIAEDNEHNRKLMRAILKSYPIEYDFAENGLEALKMAKSGLYDMVFMDVKMPEMDGLEATRSLREWEQKQDAAPTPVIALTAQTLEEHRKESLEAGCNEHLPKPVREADLINTVRKFIQSPETNPPGKEVTEPSSSESPESDSDEREVIVDKRFKELVPDLIEDVLDKMDVVSEQAQREEFKEIVELAHDVKGASGAYGFDSVQELAGEIESIAKQKQNPDRIQSIAGQIRNHLSQISIIYD